jgi:hypothetical protein
MYLIITILVLIVYIWSSINIVRYVYTMSAKHSRFFRSALAGFFLLIIYLPIILVDLFTEPHGWHRPIKINSFYLFFVLSWVLIVIVLGVRLRCRGRLRN